MFLIFSILPSSSSAQEGAQYQIVWQSATAITTSQGGGEGGYALRNAIGQPQAETVAGENFLLHPGVLPGAFTVPNLVLLYVNADNDLYEYMHHLFRRAHVGAAETDGVVMMLLDGPGDDDSRLYRLDGGEAIDCPNVFADYTCDSQYVDDKNVWRFSEDLGSPATLASFIVKQIQEYPAERVILSLVGHGGGWSPNRLAGQPRPIVGQSDDELGGLLWDFHSIPGADTGHSISTTDLGDALDEVRIAIGEQPIDLLYLDACLMGMWEVAYEVKDNVQYLLASESWSWTSFQYKEHLSAVKAGVSIEEIGTSWAQNEVTFLEENFETAYTYSLVDLSLMDELGSKIDTLAQQLIETLPDSRNQIASVFAETDRFDSSQDKDYVIDGLDNYADLGHFTQVLASKFPANADLLSAGEAVSATLSSAIVTNITQSGILPATYPPNRWEWQNPSGLSIYLPLNPDANDWKRKYYDQLSASKAHNWDEFIAEYWNSPAPSVPDCPDPCGVPFAALFVEATDLEESKIYLPFTSQ
ncbi:MAG: clostripain-related cysteine peptidase [Chloroflexota bacterium]